MRCGVPEPELAIRVLTPTSRGTVVQLGTKLVSSCVDTERGARAVESDSVWGKDVIAGRVAKSKLAEIVLPPTLHTMIAEKSACRRITGGHTDGSEA